MCRASCACCIVVQVHDDPAVLDELGPESIRTALKSDSLLKEQPQLYRYAKLAMSDGRHKYGAEFEWIHGQSQDLFEFFLIRVQL